METLEKVVSTQCREISNELLSRITYTTSFTPKCATYSYCEHPPDENFNKISKKENLNNINNTIKKEFATTCTATEKSYKCRQKMKHYKDAVAADESGTNTNYVKLTKTSLLPSTSPSSSSSSLSSSTSSTTGSSLCRISNKPLRKLSHRKNKCKIDSTATALSTVLTTIRCILSLYSKKSKSVLLKTSTAHAKQYSKTPSTRRFMLLPSIGATSVFTLVMLLCLETILLSTISDCAKTFYMHWNTSNSIFRIDNTDHIIDVNKGNLAFEFDQVHIICPVYEPGTFENETEKYIIYNVSKVEYETCRITNADPRVIAICDKPQKLMFFTITFRPFTPQPGGLEFLPGNDYYFISTSSKDDLYRRIGGRCSTNNMKVVFKVCCAPEEVNKTTSLSTSGISGSGDIVTSDNNEGNTSEINNVDVNNNNQQQSGGSTNTIGIHGVGHHPAIQMSGNGVNNKRPSSTSINTNIDHFNRIPIQTNGINVMDNNNLGGVGLGTHGGNGILLTPGYGGMQYPGQSGLRINNIAPTHHSSAKNNHNNDDHQYNKHPNEVVKNEELTYNSAGNSIHIKHRSGHFLLYLLEFFVLEFIPVNKLTTYAAAAATESSFLSSILDYVSTTFEYLLRQFKCILSILNLSYSVFRLYPLLLVSVIIIAITHFISKLLFCSTASVVNVNEIKSAKSSFLPLKKSNTSFKNLSKTANVHR